MEIFVIFFLFVPFIFTLWNIWTFIAFLVTGQNGNKGKVGEAALLIVGGLYMFLYIAVAEIMSAEWHEQLYNDQRHSFISGERLPVFYVLIAIGALAYIILRYIPTSKIPPLLIAFGIAGAYVGAGSAIVFCVQVCSDPWLFIFGFNCAVLEIKAMCIVVKQRNEQLQSGVHFTRFKKSARLLNTWARYPIFGFLALIPLMGVVLIIITLFGQQPSDLIKMWTETADWTMSQRVAPQNIFRDEHYLCTVAAGGHRKVVKPLRMGIRHGHRVVVNRQLCIANAFEEVIQQRTPRFHKVVRTVYDSSGYPIAKHIRSKYAADIIYYIMKPLEWLFLLFLYATCAHPEDRIAVQYPHSKPPKSTSSGTINSQGENQ